MATRFENGSANCSWETEGMTYGEFRNSDRWNLVCRFLGVNTDDFSVQMYDPDSGEWFDLQDNDVLGNRVRFQRTGGTKGN